MKSFGVALAVVLLVARPAWADEMIPTENGDGVSSEAPSDGTDGNERIQGPDGGYSDPGYSNPEGNYYTAAGDLTCCAPGLSQDWANNTGIYDPKTGNGTDSGGATGGSDRGGGGQDR